MHIFVGGTYGETPTITSLSVQTAMLETAKMHVVPATDDEKAAEVVWTCRFVDNDSRLFRCEATIHDGGERRLYVESMEISA